MGVNGWAVVPVLGLGLANIGLAQPHCPLDSCAVTISAPFNPQRNHFGVDMAITAGSPVYAVMDGRVRQVGRAPLAGRFIELEHPDGYRSRYMHLQSTAVEVAARVSAGTVIGQSGRSGIVTGPVLHFEILQNGQALDPMRWLKDAL